MNIKPIGKRVLIKQTEQEEVTKSGIILTGSETKEQPTTGDVIAVGNGIEEIKVGDKIIYEKYTGTEVKDGDITYLILDIDNILATVE